MLGEYRMNVDKVIVLVCLTNPKLEISEDGFFRSFVVQTLSKFFEFVLSKAELVGDPENRDI